jgi:hypothetical protein
VVDLSPDERQHQHVGFGADNIVCIMPDMCTPSLGFAVPSQLFDEIVRMIDELFPRPASAPSRLANLWQ